MTTTRFRTRQLSPPELVEAAEAQSHLVCMLLCLSLCLGELFRRQERHLTVRRLGRHRSRSERKDRERSERQSGQVHPPSHCIAFFSF